MKISFDPETDIALCQVSRRKIVHAEEHGPLIVHFDSGNHPVLLEIQDASRFIGELARLALQVKGRRTQSVQI
jgi:hypothetical protein